MDGTALVTTVIGGLAVFTVLVWFVLTFNRFVRRRNQVETTGAQIDVQLERRHDLIPNLVAAVQAYAAHERATFEAVARARHEARAAAGGSRGVQAVAEERLGQDLSRLLAICEDYPQLKASQNFLALQRELTATENRIAYARQFYNGAVQTMNTAVDRIPDRFVAAIGGFQRQEYFEAGGDRSGVTVRF